MNSANVDREEAKDNLVGTLSRRCVTLEAEVARLWPMIDAARDERNKAEAHVDQLRAAEGKMEEAEVRAVVLQVQVDRLLDALREISKLDYTPGSLTIAIQTARAAIEAATPLPEPPVFGGSDDGAGQSAGWGWDP